jgi:hypothetical protein
MARTFRVIQGCPAPDLIAPYIDIITDGATVNSIYRGDDAKSILHAHGKHTQRELYESMHGVGVNPPDRGTHILLGDGTVGQLHEQLEDWQVGFDVNDSDVPKVIAHAARLGWHVYQPYPSGSEYHHCNFKVRPGPNKHVSAQKISARRKRLPTH